MKLLLHLIFLFSAGLSIAQINTSEKRIEIDLKDGYYNERIHELDSVGFLITSMVEKPKKTVFSFRFQYYSTDLELLDEQYFDTPKGFFPNAEYKNGTSYSQLYCSDKGQFFILNYDTKSRKLEQISGKADKKLSGLLGVTAISYFATTKDYAYFILSARRRKYLFTFDLKTKTVKTTRIAVQGVKTKRLIVESPTLDTSMLYVPLIHGKPRKKPTSYLLEFDVKGELLTTTPLDKKVIKPYFNTTVSPLPNKDILLSGITGRDARFGSTAMYITTTVDETIQNTHYYDYASLPNFYDNKPGGTFRRVTLIQWIFSLFGHDVTLYYQMTKPQIIPCGDNYMYITEFFVPTYSMATTVRVKKGKRETTIKRVFNGYQYTHALVAKITKQGEMIWSQCIEMNPETKPFYNKQFLNILEQNEAFVHLFYADVDKIYEIKIDYNGEILSNQVVGKINGLLTDDQVKLSYADLDYWFDQYFISYGAQLIKNKKDKSVKRRRTVIYINKIGMIKKPL
ncbi:MAG: hypothetical protein ACKOXP_03345 [Flavobacteriales bacterium]